MLQQDATRVVILTTAGTDVQDHIHQLSKWIDTHFPDTVWARLISTTAGGYFTDIFYFNDPSIATMFKLAWGGQ